MPTTARQLDNAFKLYLDKTDSQAIPEFRVEEREQFLNDAQLYLARKITSRKSQDQDDVDLRRVLGKSITLGLTEDNADIGAYSCDIPADYLTFGRMMVNIGLASSAQNQYVQPLLVGEDELNFVLTDPFNKPTSGNPVVSFSNNRLLVYTGTDSPKGISLSYYKLPNRIAINNNSELSLPESLLPSLVQRAVQLALESVGDPRFTTQNTIFKTTENPQL